MAGLRGATAAGRRLAHRACGSAGRRRACGNSGDLAGGDRGPRARSYRQAAGRARSVTRHRRRSFAHDRRRAGRAATLSSARYISGNRHRQRPRQFHLRGARRRLVARFVGCSGAGRLLRVLRSAARRRTGAGARYARRDRGERRHRRLDRAKARFRRPPDGLRSSHLPPSRSARRPVARSPQAPRSRTPPGSALSSTSSATPSRRCSAASPAAGSRPISRWTPASCSTPSACRAPRSPRSLPSRAAQPGWHMPWSSGKPAG